MLASVLRITPARVGRRAVALLLDTSLAGVAAMVILFAIILPSQHPDYEKILREQMQTMDQQLQEVMDSGQFATLNLSDEATDIAATAGVTAFVVLLVYFAASEMLLGGATLGKRVFGLRAARWGTAEPPLGIESLSRCIFKSASLVGLWPILLLANALPLFFRPTRRVIHDYLARTIVTGDPPPPAPARRKGYPTDDH
jgi:uncharacterized RDD family membrane protein YckC